MSKFRVFIDGQSGTTGLQIRQRLEHHPDIELVFIDHELRRDDNEKRRIMKEVDVTILCLPDEAAKESAKMAQEVGCRLLDASSAHRTQPGWVYGFPELNQDQRLAIQTAQCVSNPGCYATGAIALLAPLADFISQRALTINAISGYTGGGKDLIASYEQGGPVYGAYGLTLRHKHIPEITHWAGLVKSPMFVPSVGNYAQGMLVFIPLQGEPKFAKMLHNTLSAHYRDEPMVRVFPQQDFAAYEGSAFLTPHGIEGSNRLEIMTFANPDASQALLVAKLDNLGKGASGAAVQNLNLMLGLEESLCVNLPTD
uniref:N-acetyl-gamma-glutamyl-phosphate reductase n=1 Tax=Thaumasiovibrio occultus TaxID=1891184 RepID=UPI000B364059|nr:N-acetyl-gamma-glutamyl-phosphate reductase [Thaumasiovibrio occultus]